MFSSYMIYDPVSDNCVSIRKSSYFAAALFGAFYVLVKAGSRRFAEALALHLILFLGLAGLLFVSSILPAQSPHWRSRVGTHGCHWGVTRVALSADV